MQIKIKKLVPEAIIPSYAKSGDAGMDLTAISKIYDEYGNVSYGTGLALEIPEDYVGLLFPRSSNCKQDIVLTNSVGIIDSSYRGEIIFKFKPVGVFYEDSNPSSCDSDDFEKIIFSDSIDYFSDYEIGERVGQILILPYPQINFIESDELSITDRGITGFGSSGK